MDAGVPAWPGRGDPMDDDRPLFITFKPVGKDNTGGAKPGSDTALVQPPAAEQPPGHRDTHGRVLSPPEGDLQPELLALRAQTRLWFKQTQAGRLGAEGELPAWFHGFISRRETEELLQDQPPGCFLVRFSESTVGFVLSYRGRDRCRHFVLDQLPDGRYVILGERSAHAELADLLRHYAAAPVTPYHEFLTVPCGREDEPQGGTRTPAGSGAARSPVSEAPATLSAYGTVSKGSPGARQAGAAPPPPAEPSAEGGSAREAPRMPPPLPAKAILAAAQGPAQPGGGAAPEGPYARVHEEAAPPEPPAPADAKYQQLMCFHTYAEPHEGRAPGPSAYDEREEPIPFYAVGRGASPSPEENIYSEVALARQDPPVPLPRGSRGAFSTLPPKSRAPAHRQLFRSASSQASKRRQLPAAPAADGKERGGSSPGAEATTPKPPLAFDDPVYSRRTSAAKRAAGGRAGADNVYEQLSGDRL
ncbi:LOW QUALITY PROTEIN: SH2 domain-containing protein 2A [Phoenicopterus ruber ruber]